MLSAISRVRFAKTLSVPFASRRARVQHACCQTPSLRGRGRPAAVGERPQSEGAKRRQALCGSPHRGRLAVGPVPSAEGNGRSHDADRRAYRRFAAAFSLDLETAFWKRTGAPIRYALDSAEFFALRSSAPTSPLPDGPM